jgi:hypothetical protein
LLLVSSHLQLSDAALNMNENLVTIVTILLTVFFIFAGSIKMLGWQKLIFETQLAFFKKYGLNRNLMALVGFIEILGATTIWAPGYAEFFGAALLFSTSAGAIFFHLRYDTWKDGIAAMITLCLSGFIIIMGSQGLS